MSEEENNNTMPSQKKIYLSAYVTIFMVAVNVVIFLLSRLYPEFFYNTFTLLPLSYMSEGAAYRIVSATFMHFDVQHLFNNMLILAAAGPIIEHYTGHILYLFMYLCAGIVGNILTLVYQCVTHDEFSSLGASGCTLGISGFILVWLIINRKAFVSNKRLVRNIVIYMLLVVYMCSIQAGANTIAHFGGGLTGAIFGFFNIKVFHNNKNMEGLAL